MEQYLDFYQILPTSNHRVWGGKEHFENIMKKKSEEKIKKTLTEYGVVENSAKYVNYMQLTYRKSNESALKYFTTNKGKPFKVVEGKLEYDCEVLNTVVNDKIRVLLGVVDIKVRETDDEKS